MLKWASETATKHKLDFKYAEAFQRIVLESDEDKPPEAEAIEAQAEE